MAMKRYHEGFESGYYLAYWKTKLRLGRNASHIRPQFKPGPGLVALFFT
jgi:hypothetical protein